MRFGADNMGEAVLRVQGFARTHRNCVASSAASRLEKKRFLAMSSLRSTPQSQEVCGSKYAAGGAGRSIAMEVQRHCGFV